MGIPGGDDRDLGADERADRTEPVAVHVAHALADGSSVWRDQQPVERKMRPDLRKQAAFQFRIGSGGNQPVRQCAGAEQRNRLRGRLLQSGEETAELMPGAGDRGPQGVARRQQVAAKRVDAGRSLDEGVGFVLQGDDPDSHVPVSPCSRVRAMLACHGRFTAQASQCADRHERPAPRGDHGVRRRPGGAHAESGPFRRDGHALPQRVLHLSAAPRAACRS